MNNNRKYLIANVQAALLGTKAAQIHTNYLFNPPVILVHAIVDFTLKLYGSYWFVALITDSRQVRFRLVPLTSLSQST